MKNLLVVSLLVVGLVGAGQVQAFDMEALRARLAEAQAARQERLNTLRADLGIDGRGEAAAPTTSPKNLSDLDLDSNQDPEQEPGAEPCECKAKLSLAKPEVRWSGEGLVYVPRFDVKVTVRDDRPSERWNLRLDFAGVSEFEQGGLVTAPAKQAFGGSHAWGGSCVDTKLSFNGHAEPAVSLGQLLRSLFVGDAELEGMVTSRARLTGCDEEELHRSFRIEVEEFGNLGVGRWGRVR